MWAGTRAYDVGGYHVGIRCDGPATDAVVASLLAGLAVDDPDAPVNFSVRAGDGPGGKRRELSVLYRGTCATARSRSPVRVIDRLLTHLALIRERARGDLVVLRGVALVHDGRALVVPPSFENEIAKRERALADVGLLAVNVPLVALDPATAELVVPAPPVEVDERELAPLDRDVPPEVPAVAPGRYELGTWVFRGASEEPEQMAPVTGVRSLLPLVENLAQVGAEVALDALSRTAGAARLVTGGPLRATTLPAWAPGLVRRSR